MQTFFVGVDGGATKTTVRLEDESGQLLGKASSGPANIQISTQHAWESIYAALEQVLSPLHLFDHSQLKVGMGLAGCEVEEAYQAFLQHPYAFQHLVVSSDAHIACLGAHKAEDGAILIIGTGVVGFQIQADSINKVSGWGFPHDDEGGGAWLGLQAVKLTLQYLDGRIKKSGVAQAVYDYFNQDQQALVVWANQASSREFAQLAPLIIKQAQELDITAIELLRLAADAIERISVALLHAQKEHSSLLPLSLSGGLSNFIQPFLTESLRLRLRPCQMPPESGAIILVKQHLEKLKESNISLITDRVTNAQIQLLDS